MRTGRLVRAGLGLFAGVALAAGTLDAAKAQTEEITVVVPNPSALIWMPLWVAIGEGYFEDEGLEITVEAVNGSSPVLQAMAAGQAEIGAPGPGPVLAARERGEDVVFIYNLYPKSLFGLMVREEAPYQAPAELEGEVIGVGTADGAEVAFTRAILDEADMVEGQDYEFLPIGDGGMATAAFLREDVAAYAAAISDAAILGSRGIGLREITPEEYLSFFGNGFAAMASYVEDNPEVIEGFGRALVRGTEFGMDEANRETVLEHCAAGNPQEGEDDAFAGTLLDAVAERMTPLDRSQGWGYQPPEHWQLWQDSQVASGTLAEPLPDLEAAYTNDFVEAWNGGAEE